MIDIERRLQWNIAILVVLGAMLLGFGNEGSYLATVAAVGAAVSLLFVDHLKWFHLGRFSSNLVALLVAGYSLLNFFGRPNDVQLMSIAQLLVHLQVVLLLEKKTARIYWQLFVLSVLQVVVASALRFDLHGGGVFFLYTLTAFSAMFLMLIHRDADRVGTHLIAGRRRHDELRKMLGSDRAASVLRAPPVVVFDRTRPANEITGQWRMRTLAATLYGAVFAAFLFFMIPRTGEPWVGARTIKLSMVGFTEKVKFDEDGLIAQGDQSVMRLTYRDPITLRPVTIGDDIYLRGLTLQYYGREQGEPVWKQSDSRSSGTSGHSTIGVRVRPATHPGILVQEIVMEPTGERYLFTENPVDHFERLDQRIEFNRRNETVALNGPGPSNESFRYRLAVSAFRRVSTIGVYVRRRISPYSPRMQAGRRDPMRSDEQAELLQIPTDLSGVDRFQTLRSLAKEWIGDEVDPEDHYAIATILEERLRSQGFEYTLDFTEVKRDPTLDPLEDFVRNFRKGHCEYFAGALTLMLRSRGIPCRMVMGYRLNSEDFNEIGGFYEVRSRNTHVWVEAYLGPQDVTDEMLRAGEASPAGAWVHLDPTPASSDEEMLANQQLAKQADQAFGYAQMIWDDYVVGLDAERQKGSLSGPFGSLLDPTQWSEEMQQNLMDLPLQLTSPSTLTIFVALGAFVLVVVFSFRRRGLKRVVSGRGVALLRRLAPRLAKWLAPSASGHGRTEVPFWVQFEQLLERKGVARSKSETPTEFITRLIQEWSHRPGTVRFAASAQLIVSAFQEVRYGELQLSEWRQIEIAAALESLKNWDDEAASVAKM